MTEINQQVYGPVLLVCIFNKFGNIITHDYFYQLFSQYGQVRKILIFQKAKVWKTFVQYTDTLSASLALKNLNNRPVFDDGSKMNIFSSKLPTIKLQNNNLGGVNYEELKHEYQMEEETQMTRSRKKTLDSPSNAKFDGSCMTYLTDSPKSDDQAKSFQKNSSTFSFGEQNWGDEAFSSNSLGIFDIDEQFREIAMESQEFRQLKKDHEGQSIRKKSKTFVSNPHTEQFLQENSPCKVLFIRSIPIVYTNQILYNIFRNFGIVERIIYFRDKKSALLQYEDIQEAISAKDQLNYAKPEMKIFYSHYESLNMRKQIEGEQYHDYSSSISSQHNSKISINPPSQTLYLTFLKPSLEEQIKKMCASLGSPIRNIDWKQSEGKKDKWMCLIEFDSIQQSLLVMGTLQGVALSNGKKLKISFTKSKIKQQSVRYPIDSIKSINGVTHKKYRQKLSCA